jgi:DNA modification methylase
LIDLLLGDCLERLRELPDSSVHACVTDPPYGLSFMGKRWDTSVPGVEVWREVLRVLKPGGHLLAFFGTRTYHRGVVAIEDAGFKIRDQIGWAFSSGFPKSLNLDNYRGELTCGCDGPTLPCDHEKNEASEPKAECNLRSLRGGNVSQAEPNCRRQGEILQHGLQEQGLPVEGWTQFWAPENGSGESGVEGWGHAEKTTRQLQGGQICSGSNVGAADSAIGRLHHGAQTSDGADVRILNDETGGGEPYRPQPVQQPPKQSRVMAHKCGSQKGGVWPDCSRCGKPILPKGWGTALKPAWEPIVVARKPLDGTVAANVLEHGTGALNVDGCRIAAGDGYTENAVAQGVNTAQTSYAPALVRRTFEPSQSGRWPANLIHDGSDEVVGLFPVTGAASAHICGEMRRNVYGGGKGLSGPKSLRGHNDDGGSAARFFYAAKASKRDREEGLEDAEPVRSSDRVRDDLPGGDNPRNRSNHARANHHPTVKPTDLMRYLCRLVTPPGGVVLDPFMGSGSTGKAAVLEGFGFVGIEREAEYHAIAEARIRHVMPEPPQQPTAPAPVGQLTLW